MVSLELAHLHLGARRHFDWNGEARPSGADICRRRVVSHSPAFHLCPSSLFDIAASDLAGAHIHGSAVIGPDTDREAAIHPYTPRRDGSPTEPLRDAAGRCRGAECQRGIQHAAQLSRPECRVCCLPPPPFAGMLPGRQTRELTCKQLLRLARPVRRARPGDVAAAPRHAARAYHARGDALWARVGARRGGAVYATDRGPGARICRGSAGRVSVPAVLPKRGGGVVRGEWMCWYV
jgi:hypothetical protein